MNKFSLSKQILPEVDFAITSSGITLTSERLTTPRFLPFDHPGKCRECKSSEASVDFMVCKEGVTIFSDRIRGSRFVRFDAVHDLPDYCFFKIRSKSRVFTVDHGEKSAASFRQMPIIHYLSSASSENSNNKVSLKQELLSLEDGNALAEPPVKTLRTANQEQQEVKLLKEIKKEVDDDDDIQIIKEVKKESTSPPPQLQYMGAAENSQQQREQSNGYNSEEEEEEASKLLNEFFGGLDASTHGMAWGN